MGVAQSAPSPHNLCMTYQLTDLKNHVVVITGATTGIGEATARELVEQGAKVLLNARNEAKLKEMVASFGDANAAYVAGDCSDPDVSRNIAKTAIAKFGTIDALVPLWFLYVWLIAQPEWSFGPVTKFRKLCVIKGTVIIPMLMSFFILDHTRIGVVVGGLPLFLYLLPELKLHLKRIGSLKEFKFPVLSTMLIVWIIYPAIIVDNAGVFRLPYAKFISLVSGG